LEWRLNCFFCPGGSFASAAPIFCAPPLASNSAAKSPRLALIPLPRRLQQCPDRPGPHFPEASRPPRQRSTKRNCASVRLAPIRADQFSLSIAACLPARRTRGVFSTRTRAIGRFHGPSPANARQLQFFHLVRLLVLQSGPRPRPAAPRTSPAHPQFAAPFRVSPRNAGNPWRRFQLFNPRNSTSPPPARSTAIGTPRSPATPCCAARFRAANNSHAAGLADLFHFHEFPKRAKRFGLSGPLCPSAAPAAAQFPATARVSRLSFVRPSRSSPIPRRSPRTPSVMPCSDGLRV